MVKALIGLLIAAIAAAFIRGVIGMITREVSQMVNPEQPKAAPGGTAAKEGPEVTALKKCAVCGTYSPGNRMIQGIYCSESCAAQAKS